MAEAQSFAARVLRRLPEVRRRVAASDEYRRWRDGHKSYNDGEADYWLVGGDQSKDEDEMMLDWARLHGLVSEGDMAHIAGDEPQYYR